MEIKKIEDLAELARIELPEEDKVAFAADFDGIIDYIDIVRNADVEGVELDFQHYNSWREDELQERDFDREMIINQFPDKKDNFLKVKKIL